MTKTVEAVYENGAFRPLEPVSCSEHERVIITVESAVAAEGSLLDHEFPAYCKTRADDGVSLETVRKLWPRFPVRSRSVTNGNDAVYRKLYAALEESSGRKLLGMLP